MMKRILTGLAIVAALLALGVVPAMAQAPYTATVAATDANTTTTWTFPAGVIIVSNDGANEVFVTKGGAAVAGATNAIEIKANRGKRFLFVAGKGPTSLGAICSAAETATVRIEAYPHEGQVETFPLAETVVDFGVGTGVTGAMTVDDLTTTDDLVVGDDADVVGDLTANTFVSDTTIEATTTVTAGTNVVATAGDVTAGDDLIATDDVVGTLYVSTPQTQTVADSGDGNPATATVTPTASQIQVTCNDVHGCALTLSEVGAQNGAVITIVNAGAANDCTIADSAGVQETVGALTLTPLDSVGFQYVVNTWVQTAAVIAP